MDKVIRSKVVDILDRRAKPRRRDDEGVEFALRVMGYAVATALTTSAIVLFFGGF